MRLNQITLPSTDVARGRDFYLKLGFVLIVDSAPRYVRLQAPAGETTLSIHRVETPPSGDRTVLYLESDDLDADHARLAAAGIAFDRPPRDESWLWRETRFADPDGNPLCLYHAGENRLNPPWRVKP